MFKKALIALGLLGVVGLSGCIVVEPHHYRECGFGYYRPAPVVVFGPSFGFYGGYHGYYGGGGYRHWR